jgi:CBS domain-containing protein
MAVNDNDSRAARDPAGLLAADLMVGPVVTVAADASLADAARLMLDRGVNALPVVDGQGRVVGMVGIKDVLRSPLPSAAQGLLTRYQRLADRATTLSSTRVGDVMARPAVVVPRAAPAADVAATMVNQGIHPLVVVEDERPVGVIGRADVVRALLAVLDGGPRVA